MNLGPLLRLILSPIAFLFGIVVWCRNRLFDFHIITSATYSFPIICVGNITVGGTGKTPHTEYLVRLLEGCSQLAVLSRGYGRTTKGYLLSTLQSTAQEIGDEPYQIKQKFPTVIVAVSEKRVIGVERLLASKELTETTGVVLLDDAYQHRFLTPSLSIVLVDYNRPVYEDSLLPAGRLREPLSGLSRAQIIIVTKSPSELSQQRQDSFRAKLRLTSKQHLFFTTVVYGEMKPLFPSLDDCSSRPLHCIERTTPILLVSGIASPKAIHAELNKYSDNVRLLSFPDHHQFTVEDYQNIEYSFLQMSEGRMMITTEKDATRLKQLFIKQPDLRSSLFYLPIEVRFLAEQSSLFNQIILNHVTSYPRGNQLHS